MLQNTFKSIFKELSIDSRKNIVRAFQTLNLSYSRNL